MKLPLFIRFARFLPLPLLLTVSTPASAIDKYWICGNGSWSDSSCWSLTSAGSGGAGEPLPGERAFLNQSTVADYTISYASASTGTLANIVIQKTGGGVPELLHSSNTIDTDALRIATAGTFTQTGGDLLIRSGDVISERFNGLLLGAFGPAPGNVSVFNLSGGLVSTPYTSLGRAGTAIVNHSAGTFDTTGTIEFEGVASVTYNLSGTGILNAGSITISGDGINSSTFSQTGGTNTVANLLSITDSSTYSQTGGTNAVTNLLSINDSSTYDLLGGSLNTGAVEVRNNGTLNIGSTFDFNSIAISDSAVVNGALVVDSGKSIAISGGGTLNGDLDVGTTSSANATISGGTVNGNFNLGSSGTASINDVTVNNTLTLDGTVNSIDKVVAEGGIVNNTSISLSLIITANGTGLDNNNTITLANGLINGSGQLINDGVISGTGQISINGVTNNNQLTLNGIISSAGGITNNSQMTFGGTISGASGYTNNGQLTQSGDLFLSNSGGSLNNGTIELAFDKGLDLSVADLTNNGTINLKNNTITGTADLVVGSTGIINGNGRTLVDISNAGTINARSGNLSVAGTNFTNSGLVKNSVGSNLFIDSATVNHTGSIETNASGSVVFNTAVTNTSGQTVTLKGGTLATPSLVNAAGGIVSGFGTISGDMDNSSQVDLFGASTISGDLVNQSTGYFLVRNDTTLITGLTTNNGTLETLNGSVIFEGGLINNGALLFDPSTLTLSDLTVSSEGFLAESGDPGDRIIITGDMINQSTQNTSWQTSNTTFQFNGGTRSVSNPQFLEVAGADIGNKSAGWTDNFVFGVLEIGTSDTYVKLVDNSDNSSMCLSTYCEIWNKEALYVGDLILEAGTTLDLMGFNLYALNSFTNNGGLVINGTVTVGAVPVPAAVWLFGSGLLGLVSAARRKKREVKSH